MNKDNAQIDGLLLLYVKQINNPIKCFKDFETNEFGGKRTRSGLDVDVFFLLGKMQKGTKKDLERSLKVLWPKDTSCHLTHTHTCIRKFQPILIL